MIITIEKYYLMHHLKLIFTYIIIFPFLLLLSCSEDATSEGDETQIPEIPGYELVWNDEFEGSSLDQTKWSHQNGDGSDYGLVGWGNNELQYYTDRDENISFENGDLVITALKKPFGNRDYTSSKILTEGKENGSWKYGLFEARIRLPKGQGIWPAFWMLPEENVYGGWPRSGEIDIMELVGNEPNVAHGTVHFGPVWPNNRSNGKSYMLSSGDFSQNYHLFRIVWEENEISWYVDNQLYHRVTPSSLSPDRWPFDQSFHLILNIAVGGDWPGSPDSSTEFPQSMYVDYVRVYQKVE